MQGRTLWELIERRVDATPDALMAVDEDMRTLTFAEYWAEAERAAAGLAALGVRSGDVVSWQLPTWIESMVLVAALSRLGAVQNPMLPIYREREVASSPPRPGTSLLVVPSVWRGFDFEEMADAVARRHGDMSVLVADQALPQGDPSTLPPLPDPLDQRSGGAAGSSTPRARPRIRRAPGTPTPPSAAVAAGMSSDSRSSPTTATRWCSRSPTSVASPGCSRPCSPAARTSSWRRSIPTGRPRSCPRRASRWPGRARCSTRRTSRYQRRHARPGVPRRAGLPRRWVAQAAAAGPRDPSRSSTPRSSPATG